MKVFILKIEFYPFLLFLYFCMFFPFCFLLTWESLHARLNSHYKIWSYKKKEHKMIKGYWKSLYKEPTVNSCLLILDLKALRSQVKGKRKAFYRQRIPESRCARKGTVDIGILVTSRNGGKKSMQSIRNRSYIMQRAHHLSLDPFSLRDSALDYEEKMFCCFLN